MYIKVWKALLYTRKFNVLLIPLWVCFCDLYCLINHPQNLVTLNNNSLFVLLLQYWQGSVRRLISAPFGVDWGSSTRLQDASWLPFIHMPLAGLAGTAGVWLGFSPCLCCSSGPLSKWSGLSPAAWSDFFKWWDQAPRQWISILKSKCGTSTMHFCHFLLIKLSQKANKCQGEEKDFISWWEKRSAQTVWKDFLATVFAGKLLQSICYFSLSSSLCSLDWSNSHFISITQLYARPHWEHKEF